MVQGLIEKWKKYKDTDYSVSYNGEIKNNISGLILKLSKSNGYPSFCMFDTKTKKKKTIRVHIPVCELFISERPDGYQVRHLDGNKENNHYKNLSWGTQKQNEMDKRRHGRINYPVKKYPKNHLILIRCLKRLKVKNRVIKEIFGISFSHISNIAACFTICVLLTGCSASSCINKPIYPSRSDVFTRGTKQQIVIHNESYKQ